MSFADDFTAWLRSPGTGPLGPYMDAPGPGNPVLPGQEGFNPDYSAAAAGPSPLDILGGAVQAPISAANYAGRYLPSGRSLLLLAGIGIILITVISSGDD